LRAGRAANSVSAEIRFIAIIHDDPTQAAIAVLGVLTHFYSGKGRAKAFASKEIWSKALI